MITTAAVFLLPCMCFMATDANATVVGDETMVLSGTVSENVEILPGTKKVVLQNLNMAEETELTISAPVEIEIADGTENTVAALVIMYDTKLTGGGILHVSGAIVSSRCTLAFGHSGTIDVSGPVVGDQGSIVINSGSLSLSNGIHADSNLTMVQGEIVINGGTLDVSSEGTAINAYGTVAINGGDVSLSSQDGAAILSGLGDGKGLELSKNVSTQGGLSVIPYETETGTFQTLGNAGDSKPAAQAIMSGPTDEKAIAAADKALRENAKVSGEKAAEENTAVETEISKTKDTENDGSQKIPVWLIILIAIIAIPAVIAAFVTISQKNRKHRKK